MRRTTLTGLKKQGTLFETKTYNRFQIISGSADKSKLKTIFVEYIFHFKSLTDEPVKDLTNFIWAVKQKVYKTIKGDCFHTKYILNVEAPKSIKTTKLGCIGLEFTFYPNDVYTREQLTQSVDYLSGILEREVFVDTKQYKIYRYQKEITE